MSLPGHDAYCWFVVCFRAQCFSLDEWHDGEQQPGRLSAVEQRQKIRVLQVPRDLNF
jgi:hypothetical protein